MYLIFTSQGRLRRRIVLGLSSLQLTRCFLCKPQNQGIAFWELHSLVLPVSCKPSLPTLSESMLVGPILSRAASKYFQICPKGPIFHLLMASAIIGIIAWNLALSGAEKAGSQLGHSTLPGFSMPAVDPVSLGQVAGPHCHSCPRACWKEHGAQSQILVLTVPLNR